MRAGWQVDRLPVTVHVNVLKAGRHADKLLLSQQHRAEREDAALDKYPQLTHAGQQLFLYLAGHTGLLGALRRRRMRIRIGWKGAVNVR